MHLAGRSREVYFFKQALVVRVFGQALVLFLKHQGVLAFDGIALLVVLAVLGHFIDKEQAQHLHTQGAQAFFFVQVFFDRAGNHGALHGLGVDIAPSLAYTQELFAAGHFQLNELVRLGCANFANAHIGVQRAACLLLQVETILHRDRFAPHSACGVLSVHFNAGSDDAFFVGHGQQLHIRLVAAALHSGCGHLNLLHQLLLIRIHRIQPVHHVVLVHMGG